MKKIQITRGRVRPSLTVEVVGTRIGQEHHECRLYYRGVEMAHIERYKGDAVRYYIARGAINFMAEESTGNYMQFARLLRRMLRERGFDISPKAVKIAVLAQRGWLERIDAKRRVAKVQEAFEAMADLAKALSATTAALSRANSAAAAAHRIAEKREKVYTSGGVMFKVQKQTRAGHQPRIIRRIYDKR